MTQIGNALLEFVPKVLKYIAFGIIIVPLSIVTHELGHFLAYHLFGASNIHLHSVSVSADKEMLSSGQIAITSIVGPLISYLTIGLAFVLTRKKYIPFWIMLALAAPIGRVVNGVYIYFRTLGYSPNPNFDEFNFSRSVNVDPLWLSIVTMAIVLATFFIFFRKAWRNGRFAEISTIVLSLIAGLFVWNLVGGIILP